LQFYQFGKYCTVLRQDPLQDETKLEVKGAASQDSAEEGERGREGGRKKKTTNQEPVHKNKTADEKQKKIKVFALIPKKRPVSNPFVPLSSISPLVLYFPMVF
jgi:hypothetical protein